MKKILAVGIVLVVALAFSQTGFAADVSYSVGLKTWYNKWELTVSGDPDGIETDEALMVGPNFKVNYGKIFAGISYLVSISDYEGDLEPGVTIEVDRKDLDFMLGYMLHSRFGVVGGYKNVKGEGDIDFDIMGVSDSISLDIEYTGPVIGVMANYPVGKLPLIGFVNVNYMRTDFELSSEGVEDDADGDGYSFEIGFVYSYSKRFSFSAGYKYQKYELEYDDGTDEDHSYQGLTLGMDYRF